MSCHVQNIFHEMKSFSIYIFHRKSDGYAGEWRVHASPGGENYNRSSVLGRCAEERAVRWGGGGVQWVDGFPLYFPLITHNIRQFSTNYVGKYQGKCAGSESNRKEVREQDVKVFPTKAYFIIIIFRVEAKDEMWDLPFLRWVREERKECGWEGGMEGRKEGNSLRIQQQFPLVTPSIPATHRNYFINFIKFIIF